MEAEQTNQNSGQTTRLSFDAEFFRRSEEFCNELITTIPELNGIALIPMWNNQPEKIPPGVLRLRNAQPPYLASLLNLLNRLAAFGVEVHRDLINQLRMFDQYAAELAERIRLQTEELNKIEESTNTQNNATESK